MVDSNTAIKQLKAIKLLIRDVTMRLAAEWPEKWQILISTILSAQTKDETTIEVCERLFKKYPTPQTLGNARISSIENIIRSINYYKTKAKHIKKTSQIINKKGIPENLEELLELPGVGRKVGNVYLAEAHKAEVIGVDTHVSRIAQKLGWTNNIKPHKIEEDLRILFPREYWRSINDTLVRFGRSIGKNRKKEDEFLESIKH